MGQTLADLRAENYVPDAVPDSDLEYFTTDGTSRKIGWGDTPAVLVVDMTLAFTEERADVGEPCVAANAELLEAARAADVPVFYVTPSAPGTYPDDYQGTTKTSSGASDDPDPERVEWREKLDVIAPELEPEADEVVVPKPRASSFFDTHYANLLHYYGIDTLIVTGMTTSGCVRGTVVDGHSSNFRVIVPPECVGDRSIISHELSLFDMSMKYADVTPVADVIEKLGEYAETPVVADD
ncbi:isochorismatase family protein [Natronobiforma cellulositropha]|uniref:isochorismatase family protein n=1 Tax=Natronobiforma cellulositropha TaxID=1679076 RepID=UPI0021D569D7|nr:isochorismatase family protein [Natronobiforma cellulositropha]